MPDGNDTKEAPPIGMTASIIHESRKAGEVLLASDPQKATRWMVFVCTAGMLVLAGWLGLRSITSFETVISMVLRSKEDQADRDRQHFSSESDKVRMHCSKETEMAAQRELSRTERLTALFMEERTKDRISGESRDRMVRDELVALRVLMGRLKIPMPVDENDPAVTARIYPPIPKIIPEGQ